MQEETLPLGPELSRSRFYPPAPRERQERTGTRNRRPPGRKHDGGHMSAGPEPETNAGGSPNTDGHRSAAPDRNRKLMQAAHPTQRV
eukprot:g13194.t1